MKKNLIAMIWSYYNIYKRWSMKERNEIEEKYKWDLKSYFVSEQQWEKDFENLKKRLGEISKFEGKLKEEKSIFDCLTLESQISQKIELLACYASLKSCEDQSNSKAQERLEKISSLGTKFSAESSFVDVEIGELENEFLEKLKENKNYSHFSNVFYDIIRFKPHMLSKKEEKILSLMGEFSGGFAENFDKFDDADLTFDDILDSEEKTHQLNHANYQLFSENPDRKLRENAMRAMNGAYKKFNNFLSINYISNVKKNCFRAKIRGFSSTLSASIFSEDVDENIYKMLIKQINKNLPVFFKYFTLKQKQLGVSDFAVFDLNAQTNHKVSLKIDYEKAIEIIKEATSVLGEDYTKLIERAEKERWIDVMPNKNKDSGAFSTSAYGALPVVLMNYVKNTNSIFTLIHELGHCLHFYYSNKNQPFEKAGHTIFTAEVASTVNEMLLLQHLLKKAKSKDEKIYYYSYFMNMVKGTIFRQTMFSEFEAFAHELHEKDKPLSKDVLNNFYFELNKKYFGDKVKLIDEIKYEWSRIPHFYRSFYVYKYATGLIASIAIVHRILSGKPNASNDYKKFLSSGCSLPPVELLKIAGVNLEDEKTFNSAFEYISSILDSWEEIMK